MTPYSPAWPHSAIKEIFPDIFFVTGTNITFYNNVSLQHSRNMTIVRHNNELTLINTVRLNEEGLHSLDNLGKIKHVVRIGAFHGRDDSFYLDRYQATHWALKGMQHDHEKATDIELVSGGEMPFPGCDLFNFETSIQPEGILYLNRENGILITCDSIKNWLTGDQFFSAETEKLYREQEFFGPATISNVWLEACQVKAADFARLKQLSFHHLISAHGEPIVGNAKEQVDKAIHRQFGI